MITRPIKSERSLRRYKAAGWRIERIRAGDTWREVYPEHARQILRGTYGGGTTWGGTLALRAVKPEGLDVAFPDRRYAMTWATDGTASTTLNNESEYYVLQLVTGVGAKEKLRSLNVGDSCHDRDGDKWTRVK